MPVTLNSTGITFSNGTSQSTAGLTVDTNTAANATAYALGQYILAIAAGPILANNATSNVWTTLGTAGFPYGFIAIAANPLGGYALQLTGTWRSRGIAAAATTTPQTVNFFANITNSGGGLSSQQRECAGVMQRTA